MKQNVCLATACWNRCRTSGTLPADAGRKGFEWYRRGHEKARDTRQSEDDTPWGSDPLSSLTSPPAVNTKRARLFKIRIAVSRSKRRTSARAGSVHFIFFVIRHAAEIFLRQTKLLEYFLMRNALATVVPEPVFCCLNRRAVLHGSRLIVHWSVS